MKQVLFVFLGGGAGSIVRYLIGKSINNVPEGFPLGTFVVNILGSLLIGFLLGLSVKNNVFTGSVTLLLITGFCGGFTTFSTFSLENYTLLKSGDYMTFLIYAFGSLFVSIILVFLGLLLAKWL